MCHWRGKISFLEEGNKYVFGPLVRKKIFLELFLSTSQIFMTYYDSTIKRKKNRENHCRTEVRKI
jgi:hypothetical protein